MVGPTVGYGTLSVAAGRLSGSRKVSQWAMRQWSVSTCESLGIRRVVRGAELLADLPQGVIVANHLSLVDIIVLGSVLTCDYRWLAKDLVFRIPFLGWHLAQSGHVPVYRGKRKEKNRSLPQRLHDVIAEGASLLFFPEGTRSADGKLQRFRSGAFRAAVEEGLPILPVVLSGTNGILRKGSAIPHISPNTVCTVEVLPPVYAPAEGDEDERVARLMEQVHALYRERLGE
jgi:1-acyl-sn-glycerol-3-phosphate acyltransferase